MLHRLYSWCQKYLVARRARGRMVVVVVVVVVEVVMVVVVVVEVVVRAGVRLGISPLSHLIPHSAA